MYLLPEGMDECQFSLPHAAFAPSQMRFDVQGDSPMTSVLACWFKPLLVRKTLKHDLAYRSTGVSVTM